MAPPSTGPNNPSPAFHTHPRPHPANIRSLIPPGSEYQVLYIADDNEIRSLFPSHPHSAYEQAFQGDESVRIDAMDVHVKAGRVYWTNWHTGTISFRSLPPAAPPTTSNRHRRQIDRGVTHLNVSTWHGVGSTHRHRLGRKSRRFRAELAEDSGRAESKTGGLHHKAQTADRQ